MPDRTPADGDSDRWMVVGRIAGAFGVRGELKVELLTDFPERFRGLKQLAVGPEHRLYRVLSARRHRQQMVLALEGVETPEQVAKLRDLALAVPREEAVPLPPGHYFLQDVIGMTVSVVDGESLGVVSDVLRTGSNDVFVVNEGKDALLVPVIHDAIAELNLEARRVVVQRWILQTE